jgi:hypothetical protein
MCTKHATTAGAMPNYGRIAAGLTGLLAVAASTRLTLVHVGQTDITSPLSSALIVFGVLTVVCSIVAPQAWRDGRRVLATLIVIAALAGEGFGLAASIERLASERAERQSVIAAPNHGRALAVAALRDAKAELADAVRRAADSTKGGCLAACQALQASELAARQRVAEREQSLKALGGTKPVSSVLAGLTGINADTLELVLSAMFGLSLSLGGATLIAYASSASGRVDTVAVQAIREQPSDIKVELLATPVRTGIVAVREQSAEQPAVVAAKGAILTLVSNGNQAPNSVRGLAKLIASSTTTTQVALATLISSGVLVRCADGIKLASEAA